MKRTKLKNKVIMKISNVVLIVLGAVVVGFATLFPRAIQKEKESTIIEAVMYIINNYHYEPQDINDEFSKKAFKNYIEYLDSGKRFLLQSEVDQLKEHELQIDDYIKSGDITFFENSLAILENAVLRSKGIYAELIVGEFDINSNRTILLDVEDKPFASDVLELKANWEKSITYDIISRLEEKMEDAENDSKTEEDGKTELENDIKSNLDKDHKDVIVEDKKEAKNEEKSEKKDFETLKKESKEKVKESFDKWFERLEKVKRGDRFETYLNAITSIFDPHTSYFSPKEKEDFDIRMGGKLEGIGAQLRTDGDYTKVTNIIPGGPASRGKELEADDVITAVRQDNEEEAVSIEGMVISDVVQLIRGKKGTIVFLSVKKADGTKAIIRIERDEVILDESFARSLILEEENVIDGIGYIKLPKFYSSFETNGNSCAADVAKEIEKLKEKNVKGIILDLRNNSGGSLRDVVTMSGLFIEKGPITRIQGKEGKSRDYSDTDSKVQYDGPLVIMTNQQSASASEILAAAMQDYGRAIVVGSKSTFGKGTVQRFFDLDKVVKGNDDIKPLGQLKMTMQKFFRINGGTTQLTGVIPDILLPDNYQFMDYGEKEYDNALKWTEIAPAKYNQDVVHFNHLDQIVANSKNRVSVDTNFMKVLENAKRLKRNRDIKEYPLSYEAYNTFVDNQVEEGKKFKNLYKNKIEGLSCENLDVDLVYINAEESRVDRNEKWIENVNKDFYLSEVMNIIGDMISIEEDYAEVNK